VTESGYEYLSEANSYGADQSVSQGPSVHGLRHLPDARPWPAGSKLVQWVRLDPKAPPKNLVVLAKGDGRWTHAASWGAFDVGSLSKTPDPAHWFLLTFYRHAYGFLGWDTKLVPKALGYIPSRAADMGALPPAGEWVKLDIPLEKIGASDLLLDGVGFLHEGGRVWWGKTTLVGPGGEEATVWGDALGQPAEQRAEVKVHVKGLRPGTPIRVLFEDRNLKAADGYFTDDFRGRDLYQRFGSPGYGSEPVALHVYEIGP
jgi:hypothetical protein